ncbi:fimbrial protein [Phocaeicola barnesiae]|uniref:fimbrial protein n=1 Tax=Phocaeicola barnesiae TaxID=376804 RepID=UPI0025A31B31|nr:fimbrial protein [Phocaeicola barnesiae]MDM8253214.1 fimbrial protein [Phocaeicola barnesiae]
MKVKQYIYHWLFFPLLVLLLAGGATSCSNDSSMEEEATYGKTSLVVTVRSITTASDDATTYYDEYVKTLRIIGFDASGNLVCNGFYDQLKQVTHAASIEITQELQNFQGGTCKLYFIANEDNYTTTSNATSLTLTAFLEDEKSTLTEQNLKDCIINVSSTNNQWGTNPILMTAQTSAYIQSGKTEQNIGKIELFRCVAKVQLQIVDETGSANITGTPTLSGSYPGSYSLLDVGTYTSWTGEEGNYSVNLTMRQEGSTYTSQEIYFPERLFTKDANTEANALKFSFTLNNGKSYTAAVADETGTDFNIRRNTHYTVIATLKKKETVIFNVMVNAWGEKTMDVPAFE